MMNLRNATWLVSDFGLEAVTEDGERYRIPQDALLEVDREAFMPLYRCHMVVSAQPGVDIEAFLAIWPKAVARHYAGVNAVDRRTLQDSIREARTKANHLKQIRQNEIEMTWAEMPSAEAPAFPEQDAPEVRAARRKLSDCGKP